MFYIHDRGTQLKLNYKTKVLFFRLEHSSFAANLENLILGCTMTTLEPKSISLFSQLILKEPDRIGQILSGKVSNIGPKIKQMSKKKRITGKSMHKNQEKILKNHFYYFQ